MDFVSGSLVTLPTEILLHVFGDLDRSDLAVLRQTCKPISAVAARLYFKTCATSFLRLDDLLLLANHSELSQHVEILHFHETCFQVIESPHGPLHTTTESLDELTATILDFYALPHEVSSGWPPTYRQKQPTLFTDDQDTSTRAPPNFKADLAKDLFCELLSGALQEYRQQHDFQESLSAYRRLKLAIRGFPNVKRLRFSNARDGGIEVGTSFMPECLRMLSQYFPISEGIFYTLFRASLNPPSQGFLQMLSAFHDLNRPIEEVVVNHNGGMFGGGAPMMSTSDLPEHVRALAVPAFRRISTLSLTVQFPNYKTSTNDGFASSHSLLRDLLLETTQLESLDLRFESRHSDLGAYANILPMSRTVKTLRNLRLERVVIDHMATFSVFILRGTPSLRSLSIHRCRLTDGTWQQFFQSLSDAPKFTVKSVEVSELHDSENPADTMPGIVPPGPFVSGLSVPSIVPNEALLHFINHPGSRNPFRDRKWRFFDTFEHEQALDAGASKPVDEDEFENMSEWEPSGSDYDTTVNFELEDTDGPEFNSDYDSDAETDSEEEEERTEDDVDMGDVF